MFTRCTLASLRHAAGIAGRASSLLLLAAAVAASGLVADARAVRAASLSWVNAAGGFAGTPANWSPAVRPSANDTLEFGLAGAFPVTFGVNVPATNRVSVSDGDLEFLFNVPHAMSGVLSVGTTPTVPATLDITGGQLALSAGIVVGSGALGDGTLRVSGDTSNVTQSVASSALSIGKSDGVGLFTVRDGGSFATNSLLEIGSATAGATGTLRVRGESTGPTSRRSSFTAQANYANAMRVGYPGTGVVEVLDGGLLTVDRRLMLGALTGSTGSLRVSGAGASDSARVVVTQDVYLARNLDATAAGTGTLTLEPGAVVEVADSTITFDAQGGGGGTLVLSEGARYATGSLALSDPAAQLDFPAGTLQIVGGHLDTGNQSLVVDSPTATPTLELLAGAQVHFPNPLSFALTIGAGGAGRLNVREGSALDMGPNSLRLGSAAGGSGTLEVDGASLVANGPVSIGVTANGDARFQNGASAFLADLNMGTNPAASATLTIADAGTNVNVAGFLQVSGTSAFSSGAPCVLEVRDGARLDLNRGVAVGDIWDAATLRLLNGGVLGLDGQLTVDGIVHVDGGATDGGSFYLRAGSLLRGQGDVNSGVVSTSDTTMDVRALGPLTLGRSDTPDGYRVDGTLIVNGYTVTLRDADSARVGSVWLAGGKLVLPPGGGSVYAAGVVAGSGTIHGALRNRGTIAADLSPGLSFDGAVESYGRPVSGALHFLTGSSFVGRGTLAGPIVVDAGASLANAGALYLGDVTAPGALTVDGDMSVAAAPVTCFVADSLRVSGALHMADGTLSTGAKPTLVQAGGLLDGSGTIVSSVVLDGRLAPGSASVPFDTLAIRTAILRAGSVTEIGIGDVSAGEFDRLVCTTNVVLGGTLDVRRAGFAANPGDSVRVIEAPVVTGTFANVTLDGGPVGGLFDVHVRTDGVWLVFGGGNVDVPVDPVEGPAAHALAFSAVGSPGASPALRLSLPAAARVSVEVFDLHGRRVSRTDFGTLPAGAYRLQHGLEALPAGELCFAHVHVAGERGEQVRTTRLLRLR